MRFRNVFVGLGSILTIILLIMSDPDGGFIQKLPFGAGTLSVIIILASSILYIGLLHVARKGLFDYLDLEVYFKKALQTPEGSGMALISIGLAMTSISLVILAATK